MKEVFVSYRRTDSSDVTGRIFDQLSTRLGKERLFKDVDSIPLGHDFRAAIANAVGQSKVLLVVIGHDWLTVKDADGRRRIDDPNDFVHLEIDFALRRQIPVIPLLVEDSRMPSTDDLPSPLRDLAFRNATAVRTDPDFHHDMERLCNQLEQYLQAAPATTKPKPRNRWNWMIAILGAAVAVVATIAVLSGWLSPGYDEQAERVRWTKNWHTVNEPRGHLGSSGPPEEGGGSFTNREAFLDMLDSFDFSTDQSLEKLRLELRGMVRAASPHPKGESYYNMRITEELRISEDRLVRGIRNQAVQHGVDTKLER